MAAKRSAIHDYRNAILSDRGPKEAIARLVALTIAQTMDSTTLESFAGAELIAKRSGLSERCVRKQLAALVRSGWLDERFKGKGRNHWLKVRTARIPDSAHPAPNAGTTNRQGAPDAGSRDPARDDGHPARQARHPALDAATPCTGALGQPAPGAAYLGKRSRNDLEQDPVAPALATLNGHAGAEELNGLTRNAARKAVECGEFMIAHVAKQHGITTDELRALAGEAS